MSDVEQKFYALLQDLGLSGFNINETLHDIPSVLNRIHKVPLEKLKAMKIHNSISDIDHPFMAGNFPIHSICQYPNVDVRSLTVKCIEKWNTFEKSHWNASKHPSNDPDNWNYCPFSKFSMENLKDVMRIMKFAIHMYDRNDIEQVYNITKEMNLPYKIQELEGLYKVWGKKGQVSAMKTYSTITPMKAGKLVPKMTTDGICKAWIPSHVDVFKKSTYQNAFDEVFGSKTSGVKMLEDNIDTFTIILDKNQAYNFNHQKDPSSFR